MGLIKEEAKKSVQAPNPSPAKISTKVSFPNGKKDYALIAMVAVLAVAIALTFLVPRLGGVTPIGNTTTYSADTTSTVYQVTGTSTYTIVQVNYAVTTTNGQAQTTTITLSCQATTTDNTGQPAC